MKIGIYDHNSSSGLTPFETEAQEKNIPLTHLEELTSSQKLEMDVLIINPTLNDVQNHSHIRTVNELAEANGTVKILYFDPACHQIKSYFSQPNIEYLSFSKCAKRIFELLGEAQK